MGLLTLVEPHEARHIARSGTTLRCTERAESFCAHAIAGSGDWFEVNDLSCDARFASHQLVAQESGLRHYAAAVLRLDGHAVGTLCVLDPQPGPLAPDLRQWLQDLARLACELLQQRRQRLALEEQVSRLRDLTRASGDWAWEVDAEWRCRWISGDFQAVTGLDPASVLDRPIAAEPLVEASGEAREPACTLIELMQARQPFSRVTTVCETPRGRLLLSRSGLPVYDERGEFRGYRGSARDVTARLEREALLRDKAAVEAASRAKSAFLSRVSHELRTPLNAILGFAQLMALDQQHPLPAPQAQRLDGVRRAGQGLLELINDVLDVARLEQGAVVLRPRALALDQAVQAALAMVQPMAAEPGVRLHMDVPAGLQVQADAQALEQLLMNLLSNAIKYNQPGGEVRVSATLRPQSVQLHVMDTGPGLSEAEQAQLFQPFNRLGAERRRIQGSGLGLVIVRQLARAMAGEISVHSEAGEGCIFSVDLPLAQPEQAAPTAVSQPEHPPSPTPTPRNVLYIEDEPLNVVLMQEIFKAQPAWTLHVARDGSEGVEMALRLRPDLALIDMNLPDFNGLEVLRRLRARPETRELRCVALSADAMAEQIAVARAAGFDDYWTKPIDLAHLLDAVGRAFGPQTPA